MSDRTVRGADAPRTPSGTLVLGLGTPLMADDGVGLAALDMLREGWTFSPPVELVDGGTWGMNLLGLIEDAERLLLLDAIQAGRPAGSLVVLRDEELPRYLFTKVSPHQIDLREVLALAELRGNLPADAVAVGVQPARVEMASELSPIVRDTLPTLVAAAVATLRSWGHRVERIAPHEDRTPGQVERARAG